MSILRRLPRGIFINTLIVVLSVANLGLVSLVNFYGHNYLEITFLNVGQGDSFLVNTPDKFHMMVDGGPDERSLHLLNDKLQLWEKVDVTMLSHPDADHIGALPDVIKKYNPRTNLANDEIENRTGTSAGDRYTLGCCVRIDILWPLSPELMSKRTVEDTETNDKSITFILQYGNFTMFSGGDIGKGIEEEILDNNPDIVQQVDLLKVGHHGSKTSTSELFIQRLRPSIAIIQVGEKNKYGHPNAGTLATLSKFGTNVYRNDQNGTIKFITDGNGYRIETEN